MLFDPLALAEAAGYIGLFGIVFAESGILMGFFFPGDSLLFMAGFLASQHIFDIRLLIPIVFTGAVLGDTVGYWFGSYTGPKIFTKEDSFFFNKKHIARTQLFYEKYGPKIIILARFLPIVRTFAPILAGVGEMRYRLFFTYNVLGAFLWACGLPILGFYVGSFIPNADKYIIPIILGIILISFLPLVRDLLQRRKSV
jgi:membrane-associated protein